MVPDMYLFVLRTLGGARYVSIWTMGAEWCPICIYLDYGRLVVPGIFLTTGAS